MKLRFLIQLTIVLLILVGCTKDGNRNLSNGSFYLVDSLKLPALSFIPPKTICAKYYDDGISEYLLWANRAWNQIEIYNITNITHEKSIKIPEEGPGSIPNIHGGFTIVNMDTIIVSSSRAFGKLFVIDTTGISYNTVAHTDTSVHSLNGFAFFNSKYSKDAYFISDDSMAFQMRTPGFRKKPNMLTIGPVDRFKIYDFTNQSIWTSPIKINQEIFLTPRIKNTDSNARLNSRIYYQNANSSIVYYTDDFLVEHENDAPSKYQREYVSWDEHPSPFIASKYMFHYISLFSDPYRQLIYRIVKLPASNPDLMNSEQEEKEYEFNWDQGSIMVFDADLNLLNEILFPTRGNYSWTDCFVGRKGFYIRRSPDHPYYSESKISYDIFEYKDHNIE